MKNKLLIAIGVLLIGGALLGFLGYKFVYNKPHRNIENATADFTVTASELYGAFEADETAAFAQYADKVLVVEGTIESIESQNETMTTVVLAADGAMMGGISILLAPAYGSEASYKDKLGQYEAGDNISLKGQCTGFGLFGVEMKNGFIQ